MESQEEDEEAESGVSEHEPSTDESEVNGSCFFKEKMECLILCFYLIESKGNITDNKINAMLKGPL